VRVTSIRHPHLLRFRPRLPAHHHRASRLLPLLALFLRRRLLLPRVAREVPRVVCQRVDHPRVVCQRVDRPREVCQRVDHPRVVCQRVDHPREVCQRVDHPRAVCPRVDHPRAALRVDHPRVVCPRVDHPRAVCPRVDHPKVARVDHPRAAPREDLPSTAVAERARVEEDHPSTAVVAAAIKHAANTPRSARTTDANYTKKTANTSASNTVSLAGIRRSTVKRR